MNILEHVHPALIDSCTEFFNTEKDTYDLCNGLAKKTNSLSQLFTQLLKEELDNDPQAQKSLTKLGIIEPAARIRKFYDCNYSAFDLNPDITKDGKLGPREYVPCILREGGCKFENKLCRNPLSLTNREMQIAKRIALGHMDTQICYELFISENTLRNHKNRIEFKIGRKGKPAIASWVEKNNLA
jgi:DNA-binding CsgD family transcriptional regulator